MQLLKPIDFLYLIDLVILPLILRYKKIETKEKKFIIRIKNLVVSLICVCICFMYVYLDNPLLFSAEFSRPDIENSAGIMGMFIIDDFNYIKNNFVVGNISEESKKNIDNQLNSINIIDSKYKGKNLIMIQVESLQQFVINKKYNGKEITPNLNRLIQESAYFDNCYYQVGLGHTCDAELLTNTSLYPVNDGAAFITKYNNTYISIAEGIKKLGYSTEVLHGNYGSFWNRTAMYKAFKYDEFYSLDKLNKDNFIGMGLSDESFLNQSFDIIIESKKPIFSFLITVTSHEPYNYKINNLFSNSNIIENYYNAINYTDKELGLFVDKLEKSRILDDSILIIYGDHNAISLNDKSKFEEAVGEKIDNLGQWQKYQKVPMIIRFPNQENKGVNHKSIGQIDVAPTISNLYGINDSQYFGRNIFETGDNLVVLRDGSYIYGDENYNAKENKTYNIKENSVIVNNDKLIDKAKKQLEASDEIFKYDFFKEVK